MAAQETPLKADLLETKITSQNETWVKHVAEATQAGLHTSHFAKRPATSHMTPEECIRNYMDGVFERYYGTGEKFIKWRQEVSREVSGPTKVALKSLHWA